MRRSFAFALLTCLGLGLASLAVAGDLADEAWGEQLTVYAIPAPRPLAWTHPRRLAFTAIGNFVAFRHRERKHPIGHVFVRVQSASLGKDVWTGMTSRGATEDRDLILEDAYGLGVMTADMMGRLETKDELVKSLEDRARTGLIASMRFLVRPETTARLLEFLEGFRAQGQDDHYGGANRPRYGEGGGCSAFGVAFLQVAGLMQPAFDDWKVDVRIPEKNFGGPFTGLRATMRSVIWSGRRWATEDEPHVRLEMWEPTLMYRWVRRQHQQLGADLEGAWDTERYQDMRGLVCDRRDVATPQDSIWRQQPEDEPHPWGRQVSVRRDDYEGAPLTRAQLTKLRSDFLELLEEHGEDAQSWLKPYDYEAELAMP